MKIKWEEPPTRKGGKPSAEWQAIADQLRSKPGQWAMIGRMNANMASEIRYGRKQAFRPAGSFEIATRNAAPIEGSSGRVADIYARYVGDGQVDEENHGDA